MKRDVYISIPISISWDKARQVIDKMEQLKSVKGFSYWDRDEKYNPDYLNEADTFILILPNCKFNYTLNALPAGCKKELEVAQAQGKEIFIAYWNMQGDINIYETDIDTSCIFGRPGTTGRIAEQINTVSDMVEEVASLIHDPKDDIDLYSAYIKKDIKSGDNLYDLACKEITTDNSNNLMLLLIKL